jgi:hypothetical protein
MKAPFVIASLLVPVLFLTSCNGGSDGGNGATPDPFEGFFREGIYIREKDGDNYEIRFGVAGGIYSLSVNGEERRRGSFTPGFAPPPPGQTPDPSQTRMAMIDRPESPVKCANDQEPGTYEWDFDDNKLKLEVFAEECEERKQDLESGDWEYQGPLPTTPAPAH